MRIALEISGHMRSYYDNVSVSSLKAFMERNSNDTFDIFISTYNQAGFWAENGSETRYGVDNLGKNYELSELEKDIINIYNPKAYEIENFDDVIDSFFILADKILDKNKTKQRYGPKQNNVGQLYKIHRVSKLRREYEEKNNFKYDLVIRARPDTRIYAFDYLAPESGYIQSRLYRNHLGYLLFNDTMFCGTSDDMFKLTNIYNDLEDLCDKKEIIFDPHDILKNATEYYDLKVKDINLNIGIHNTPNGYCKK